MSTIELYMVHDSHDAEWSGPYADYDDAKEVAQEYSDAGDGEPFAVITQQYEYIDSDLAWTTNGDDTWPPKGLA